MTREELYSIVADSVNHTELYSKDIPAIDLYVDQITNLVSSRLEQGSPRFYDKQLTKTMINNYSKEGIIMPIKGKKYSKEQIIQILCVYSLKNTLSIGEIKRLLDGAYSGDGFDADGLIKLYDRHQTIKDANGEFAQSILDRLIDSNSIDVSDDEDYISTICALVSLSAHLKNIARAMIDEKFPEPSDEPEESRKEEKEKKEKQPKEKKKKKEEAHQG